MSVYFWNLESQAHILKPLNSNIRLLNPYNSNNRPIPGRISIIPILPRVELKEAKVALKSSDIASLKIELAKIIFNLSEKKSPTRETAEKIVPNDMIRLISEIRIKPLEAK